MFRFIVITSENAVPDEAERINELFEAGLYRLHLRKPHWTEKQVEVLLNLIGDKYHPKIAVHYHTHLAKKYSTGGLHLKAKDIKEYKSDGQKGQLSCGVHSWEGFKDIEKYVDYAFVSPFFDSISKTGYLRNEHLSVVPGGLEKKKIVALGGIQKSNLMQVEQLGIGGAAVLGAIWNVADTLKAYKELKMKIS